MTSTRLPGKVLAEVAGRPLLAYMLARVRRAESLDAIWVATTPNATDDPVASLCETFDVPVFRGDEADVLGRFDAAAEAAGADIIVRLTADCPLMDPGLIDAAVEMMGEGHFDYLSNAVERTYPDGLDVEVFTRAALQKAAREAHEADEREHVTPYMRGEGFRIGHLRGAEDLSEMRWTVDTPADLAHVRAMAAALPADHDWRDALALVGPANVVLRPAEAGDADLLLAWANADDSLANKLRTTEPIPRETHVAWLARICARDDAAIWIAETVGKPKGQVRLERRGDALEVDVYVAPAERGKGIALTMLDAARQAAATQWPGGTLMARIKPENRASLRLFEKAGYVRTADDADHVVLCRGGGV